MAIKSYKPTSAGRRFVTVLTYDDLTPGAKPEKSLMHDQRHSGGRNNMGRITTRHIGGGNRRKYRIIDFKRTKDDIPATVKSIQYDPNRSAHIALLVVQLLLFLHQFLQVYRWCEEYLHFFLVNQLCLKTRLRFLCGSL